MLVVVQGDPLLLSTTIIGLDILAPRHPKLHALLVNRLGFQLSQDSRGEQRYFKNLKTWFTSLPFHNSRTDVRFSVIATNGEVATGCEPDSSGRQVSNCNRGKIAVLYKKTFLITKQNRNDQVCTIKAK